MKIPTRIAKRAARLLQSEGEDIIVRWQQRPAGGAIPGFNPNDHATYPTDFTSLIGLQATLRATVHAVAIDHSRPAGSSEVRRGDVIIDAPGDLCGTTPGAQAILALEGGEPAGYFKVTIEIAGSLYVPKSTGQKLQKAWDARTRGKSITRTFLLQPMR